MNALNKYLEIIKVQYGLSAKELAAAMGVQARQVNNYISGNSDIPMKNAGKLAEFLNLSVAKLMEDAENYILEKSEVKHQRKSIVNEPETNYNRAKGSVSITLDLSNQVHLRMLREYLKMSGAEVIA